MDVKPIISGKFAAQNPTNYVKLTHAQLLYLLEYLPLERDRACVRVCVGSCYSQQLITHTCQCVGAKCGN